MTETYYPVTYQPDRLPRKKSSRYGFGTNPIIFLSPNRQHKLSQEEYESISALPRYQTMVEQGAIVEGSPITIEAKKEEKKATKKKTLNKNNLFDDLTGFSLTQAKKEVSKEENREEEEEEKKKE